MFDYVYEKINKVQHYKIKKYNKLAFGFSWRKHES